jgi:predicted MFS family arabinose efflux permease
VLAARTLPMVGSVLIGGVVADRVSRQRVMVAADLARVVTQGLLAGLLIAGEPPIWSLAVLAGLTGAANGFFNPAATGLLPAVVPPEHLQQANGLRATALSGGEIVGPALAGVLVATVGPGWALAIDAATFAVSAAFLVRLRVPARLAREATSFVHDLRTGWVEFWRRSWVWSVVLAAGFGNLVWASFGVLGPVVADRDLGGAAVWGTVMAAMGIGALVGGVTAIRIRPRRPLVLSLLVLTMFAFPPALLAAEAPTAVLAVGTFLAGAGMMLGISLYEATLQLRVPSDVLSRVSSYDWFFSLALQPIGLAIWGPIAAGIGIDEALWLAAGPLLTSVLAPLAIREVRTMPGALASSDP